MSRIVYRSTLTIVRKVRGVFESQGLDPDWRFGCSSKQQSLARVLLAAGSKYLINVKKQINVLCLFTCYLLMIKNGFLSRPFLYRYHNLIQVVAIEIDKL